MVWSNLGAAALRVPTLSNDACQRRAIDAFRKALELDRRAPNVAYHLGLVHQLRGEWQEAARCFQMALDADPQDRDALKLRDRMQEKAAEANGDRDNELEPPAAPAS
jgi:tetratricopeptide (TPR) repeat protein